MNEYVLEKTNRTGNKIAQLKKEKKIEIKVKILYECYIERSKPGIDCDGTHHIIMK